MDPHAEIKNGKIVKSPEMERRIETFKRWYDDKGGIIVQTNVEDTKLGVPEYVIEKLGLETFEMKWGQGAKDIGGEVKLPNSFVRFPIISQAGSIYVDTDKCIGCGACRTACLTFSLTKTLKRKPADWLKGAA